MSQEPSASFTHYTAVDADGREVNCSWTGLCTSVTVCTTGGKAISSRRGGSVLSEERSCISPVPPPSRRMIRMTERPTLGPFAIVLGSVMVILGS